MHRGMSWEKKKAKKSPKKKTIIVETVWLIEDGTGVFFTPTVPNLSVHSLLQFNHSSHCQESLHPPAPTFPM